MARRHGRNARVMVTVTTGEAVALSNQNSWSIDSSSDKQDATCFGDTTKTYVAGLPDAKGQIGGLWDSTGNDLYAASQDGVARKFYLYPDYSNDPTHYYYGTATFDFSPSGDVGGIIKAQSNWAAATPLFRLP